METMRLAELTELLGLPEMPDAEIKSVVTDSRKITKDCLFVALSGEKFDGNAFVEEALDKGAAAAVSTRVMPDRMVLTVPDTLAALGAIARYYKSKFSVLTVAVTGSVGKTTTKEFIYAVLSEKYKTLKTEGNFNNEIGLPLTIFGLDSSYEALVLEMGMNHAGEMHRLSCIGTPDIAVITNVGTAHIENLGSREGIRDAKLEILDGLKESGMLIYNADEPLLAQSERAAGVRHTGFGIENEEADLRAGGIFELEGETDFIIEGCGEQFAVNIATIGRHNVANALCAAAVGLAAGLTPGQIADGLTHFENAGGRQNIYHMGGVRLIDDTYNANPDSMRAALSVLASFPKRRIAVLGDMLELGAAAEQSHREIGMRAAACCERLFALGPLSKACREGALVAGMAEGAARHFENRQDLVCALKDTVREGDTVLFKGSHSMHMDEALADLVRLWNEE